MKSLKKIKVKGMPTVQTLFNSTVAMHVTGASPKNIHLWVTRGIVTPTLIGKKKAGYRWSFRDLVALRIVATLRHEHNVSFESLRRIVAFLREHDMEWSLASVVIIGNDVFWIRDDQWISLMKQPGQLALIRYPIEYAERDVRQALYKEGQIEVAS
jgi:DNA-binding transcriptional MerR regulator